MTTFTVDWDEDAQAWTVVRRDEDMMPVDQHGLFATLAQARRSAANRRYALANPRKTIRIEVTK